MTLEEEAVVGVPLFTVDLMTEDKSENLTDKELEKLPAAEEVGGNLLKIN